MSLATFTRIFSHFNGQFFRTIYHQLLPPICILCGDFTLGARNLCTDCHKNLPILSYKCVQCAKFLPALTGEIVCGSCLKQPPPFTLTHALFSYQTPIPQLIIALKFQRVLSYAQTLGELLTERIVEKWYQHQPLPDLIIPMPLHVTRLRERGFNQALEIARPIAKQLMLPIDRDGIKRIKDTAPQSNLSALARKLNITNAFVSNRNYANLTVAVLDDVITTGHTMTELCKMLKKSGAKSIHVWCCARRG